MIASYENQHSTIKRGGRAARLAIVWGIVLPALCVRAEEKNAASDAADPPPQGVTVRSELQLARTSEYDYEPPAPGTYPLPAIKPAGDGAVLHLSGRPDTLRDILKDHITILSFIYTRCTDPSACPYATGVLYKIHAVSEQDPALAKSMRLITFSFDPDYDTPYVLSDYSRALRKASGAEWMFLTTANQQALAPILEAYGQPIDRKSDPHDSLGPFNHLLRVYLIDRQGTVRNIYSTGMLDPRLVISDVRTLLLEGQAQQKPKP